MTMQWQSRPSLNGARGGLELFVVGAFPFKKGRKLRASSASLIVLYEFQLHAEIPRSLRTCMMS